MKKRIALLAALAVLVAGVVAGIGSAATTSTKSATATKANVITVISTDFKFKFTGITKLKHGVTYTLKFTNKGAALHNIDITGVGHTKVLAKGKSQTIKIKFKKAGKYSYLCDVPRHAELGMAGRLTVK
jgi:plastocyanin